MYRPNDKEEKQLLELSRWIEKAKEEEQYSNYVTSKISIDIKFAWEHIKYRQELCSEGLEATK